MSISDNIAIKATNVSKSFKLPTESTQSFRTAVVNWFKGIRGYKRLEVLKDLNFEVEKGDFFGIVGRNGAGKSTLLKIISEIYRPNGGKVEINGKLVSFIELSVGFNGELTGRDNVYLNGAMLGFSTEEMDEMYDDIVEFAELGEFMDQKLKNFSSGMKVRLAFSVAIKGKGDILILDEVLAVGDAAFQKKCNNFFKEIKKDKSKTVVLVSHSMEAVRQYCNKAMLINNGEIVECSDKVDEVAMKYSELFSLKVRKGDDPRRMGNGRVTLENVKHVFDAETHTINFSIQNNTDEVYEDEIDIGINFFKKGAQVAGNHLSFRDYGGLSLAPHQRKELVLELPNRFGNGEFTCDMNIKTDQGRQTLDLIRAVFAFTNIYSGNSNSTYTIPFELTDESEHKQYKK